MRKSVVALVIVALMILAGQTVADSTSSTVNGSASVIVHDDGIITIQVKRPVTSGGCIPEAYLKVRPHPNGRWIRLGRGQRSIENGTYYLFSWDWQTFPGFRDGIWAWTAEISCGLGSESGIVVVDNSDLYDPGDDPFPRSSPPPKKDDKPGDGGIDNGSTGGGWTDPGRDYTWTPGGTGDVPGGTTGDGNGTDGGATNPTSAVQRAIQL